VPLALAALAAMLLFYLGHSRIVDPDLFHEMALARAAMARGALPAEDLFAYTPTVRPLVDHEWGTGFLLYGATSLFGAAGLVGLKLLLGFATFGLALAAARAAGAGWESLASLAPLGIAMADVGFTNVRAQFFTLAFLALLAWMLARDRRGRRAWIAAWLPAFAIWLNLHGGFVVGGVLLGAWVVEEALRRRRAPWHLVACGAAMAALVPLNPYGVDYVRYLSGALAMPRPRIAEWSPLWTNPALVVLLAVSLEPLVYAAWKRGIGALPGWLPLVLFAGAAVRHGRHLSLYAVLWTALAPAWIEATPLGSALRGGWRRRPRLVAAISVVAIVGGLGGWVAMRGWTLRLPCGPAALAERLPVIYPVGAVDYLERQRFQGNVMTPFEEGAYVSWRLYPRVKVGLDSRYEVAFRPGVAEGIWAFYDGAPGWRTTLGRYPTDVVLVAATQPIAALLPEAPGWTLVYRDDVYLLFARPGLALPFEDARGRPAEPRFP
jgi:hypothetical protein